MFYETGDDNTANILENYNGELPDGRFVWVQFKRGKKTDYKTNEIKVTGLTSYEMSKNSVSDCRQ